MIKISELLFKEEAVSKLYKKILVQQSYLHLPKVSVAHVIVSSLLVIFLKEVQPIETLLIWIGVLWSVTGLRLCFYKRNKAAINDISTGGGWDLRFKLGAIATALTWGASGIFLFPENSVTHQAFLAMVLAGMSSGAAISLSADQGVLRFFIACTILPLMCQFFLIGGETYWIMGIMLFSFSIMTMVISANIYDTLVESISLRYENSQEIEERKKAQQALMRYKDSLEKIVEQRTASLEAEIALREKVERDLRRINERYSQITNNLPGLVYQFVLHQDGSYSIPYVNQGVELVFNLASERIINRIYTRRDFIFPEDRLLFDQSLEQSAANLSEYNHDFRVVINRQTRWLNIRACPKRLDNGDTLWDGILFDVTELKQMAIENAALESQLQKSHKLEAVGVLAGGIAHDFNNLLAAILGNINLALLNESLDEKTKKLLSEAERACIRSRGLTQQLLTFSKGGEPVKEAASLSSIIQDSASFVLHGGRVMCDFQAPSDLWCVDVDKGQISQVLQNMVLNASQAMPNGGVVRIRCENVENNGCSPRTLARGRYVKLTIEDNGIGISPKALEKIFDPYFSTKQTGHGLGLAITHSIIAKHQGYIDAVSTLNKGTCFTILLPAAKARPPCLVPDQPSSRLKRDGRILIMDDEEQIRTLLQAMLSSLGYTTVLAKNGHEAIAHYQASLLDEQQRIDLTIMDLTVPGGLSGKQTMEQLMALDPEVRVIVSSGYSTDPIMSTFKAHGFVGALAKPYQQQELESLINEVLVCEHRAQRLASSVSESEQAPV